MYKYLKYVFFLSPFLFALIYLFYNEYILFTHSAALLITVIISVFLIVKYTSTHQENTALSYKEQSSIFVDILENLTDPFLLLDKDKKILMANKSATELFQTKIVNKNICDYLFDTEAILAINRAIETGENETVEYSAGNSNKRHFLLRIHPHDYKGKDDGLTLFLGIYEITNIREAEQMRVDFVANVSHELRTPLASIQGFVETLQGAAKNDPQASDKFLKIMQDEASRMTRLIEDLLSLSHIERDAHIPPSENISLIKIIESVIETLKISMDKRNITASFSTEFNSGNITGDRDQLTQVFQNLIDNAIKYGAENSVISINLHSHLDKEDNQKYLEINVTNQGVGISPEHLKRLTERFYRVDTARSRSLGGTGLGLAIVKHIIQRHEGKLLFESEPGKNTTATVLLPQKS